MLILQHLLSDVFSRTTIGKWIMHVRTPLTFGSW